MIEEETAAETLHLMVRMPNNYCANSWIMH